MNKEVIKRWIKALRSGEYTQICGNLRSKGGFCATGILCDLHAREFNILWNIRDLLRYDLYLKHGKCVPDEVINWSGIIYQQASEIAGWNDRGDSFEEIATRIEAQFGVNDE